MLWINKEDKQENCLVQQLQPPLLLLQQQEYQFHLAQCLDKAKQESFQLIVQQSYATAACGPDGVPLPGAPGPGMEGFDANNEAAVAAAAAAAAAAVSVDLDSATESNHDTALTLACAGGHEDLVTLLLGRGSDIGKSSSLF